MNVLGPLINRNKKTDLTVGEVINGKVGIKMQNFGGEGIALFGVFSVEC